MNIPVITWGSKGGNEHNANEFVYISQEKILYNMYKELLENIEN